MSDAAPKKTWADMDEEERAKSKGGDGSTPLDAKLGQLKLDKAAPSTGTSAAAEKPTASSKLSADAKPFVAPGAGEEKKEEAAPAAAEEDDEGAEFEPQTQGIDPRDKTAKVELSGNVGNVIYKSITTFDELGLSPGLLKGVTAMGFTTPSKIQAEALPIVLSEKHPNMIAQAHHGSGKTATYSLAMLSRVDPAKKYPQALCVCPVRELALQVHDVLSKLSKYTELQSFCAIRESRKGKCAEQVVVGTPGTILSLIKNKSFDTKKVEIFVLDEADLMIDKQGMSADMMKIKKTLRKDVQALLFSATYADRVKSFAAKTAPDATKITIKRDQLALDNIKQFKAVVKGEKEKYELLSDIYALLNIGQSIIFCQTRKSAANLCRAMRAEGFKVSLLHGGDMSVKERDNVMEDFRKGATTVLVSTDALSRGIDVPATNVVINYEPPLDRMRQANPETYIHRIGRSGRFGRQGVAITLVHDQKSAQDVERIAQYYNAPIEQLPSDVDEIATKVKAALNVA